MSVAAAPSEAAVLRPGKDKAVRNRHPWIFSGAIRSLPAGFENGAILPVRAADGTLLGHGYFNTATSIAGRMLNFDATPPLESLAASLDAALALRRLFFGPETTAYRLVNGEGDGLPGLVADLYGDVLVLQVSTRGMERLKPFVLEKLAERIGPRAVFEKSNVPARKEEGLPMFEGPLRGAPPEPIEVLENGLRFRVDVVHGQKTGFYLDQREMRAFARSLARGRRVLNAFAYTGGFTVAAYAGGAAAVETVDASERAVAAARENAALNGFADRPGRYVAADVFEFLRQQAPDYDLVVLDPPAFAKKKSEIVPACRGYKDIHRLVFQGVPPRSFVMTFSCSFFVDETLFRQVIFQAAREAGRDVRVLQRHRQAFDHPVNIYHPESEYLKGFLLHVD